MAEMEKTKVVGARPRSHPLRTTIAVSSARILGIEEATELGWELQAKDDQFVLDIRVLGAVDRTPHGRSRRDPREAPL